MQQSNVKSKLLEDEPILSVKVAYQDPAICELIGLLGFDAIWICTEHLGIDPSKLDAMIRACRAGGTDAIVRVKPSGYPDILHPLEWGAKGLMLPRVKSPEEVQEVAQEMKFHPEGRRGCDAVNAEADFGLLPLSDYLTQANANNFLIVQIEEPEALDHLEAIAEIQGVDILFIGPGDLSIKLGIPGDMEHPKMEEVRKRVLEVCRKKGKAAGIPCATPDQLKACLEMGFKFINYGGDHRWLKNAFQNVRQQAEGLGFRFR